MKQFAKFKFYQHGIEILQHIPAIHVDDMQKMRESGVPHTHIWIGNVPGFPNPTSLCVASCCASLTLASHRKQSRNNYIT